jgi:hypothetical protein
MNELAEASTESQQVEQCEAALSSMVWMEEQVVTSTFAAGSSGGGSLPVPLVPPAAGESSEVELPQARGRAARTKAKGRSRKERMGHCTWEGAGCSFVVAARLAKGG